jgi:hypothetical protein
VDGPSFIGHVSRETAARRFLNRSAHSLWIVQFPNVLSAATRSRTPPPGCAVGIWMIDIGRVLAGYRRGPFHVKRGGRVVRGRARHSYRLVRTTRVGGGATIEADSCSPRAGPPSQDARSSNQGKGLAAIPTTHSPFAKRPPRHSLQRVDIPLSAQITQDHGARSPSASSTTTRPSPTRRSAAPENFGRDFRRSVSPPGPSLASLPRCVRRVTRRCV